MSDDVAAVLAKKLCICTDTGPFGRHHYTCPAPAVPKALAALTAAGIACVHVPEGVEVEHGARLVALGDEWCGRPVLGIEPAEKDGACYCGPNGGPHWHTGAQRMDTP